MCWSSILSRTGFFALVCVACVVVYLSNFILGTSDGENRLRDSDLAIVYGGASEGIGYADDDPDEETCFPTEEYVCRNCTQAEGSAPSGCQDKYLDYAGVELGVIKPATGGNTPHDSTTLCWTEKRCVGSAVSLNSWCGVEEWPACASLHPNFQCKGCEAGDATTGQLYEAPEQEAYDP